MVKMSKDPTMAQNMTFDELMENTNKMTHFVCENNCIIHYYSPLLKNSTVNYLHPLHCQCQQHMGRAMDNLKQHTVEQVDLQTALDLIQSHFRADSHICVEARIHCGYQLLVCL